MRKKILIILIIIAAAALAAFFVIKQFKGAGSSSGKGDNVAYVQSVSDFMGLGSGNGMMNRFSGVVEAQDSWSVKQESDSTVKEIYVTVGQEVTKGTPLFAYDTEKYESDLAQANIDLERLNNELTSLNNVLADLQKQQKKAASSEKESFNIQIEEQNLNIKQKNIDIQSKQVDIDKLQSNIDNATVTSAIDGVVQKINSGTDTTDSEDSFITIMQTGDLRIKGKVNEQNISDLYEGAEMIIYSRADSSKTWKGSITKIDTENKADSSNSDYGYASNGESSTSYPFYVELDSTDGLMLGQHVYMEVDMGQNSESDTKEGVWLDEYLIDLTNESNPFVWKDDNGTLVKQPVTLGEHDENLARYLVTDGLSETDRIAVPDTSLSEGMKTDDMANMVYDESDLAGEDMTDEYMTDEGMTVEGAVGYADESAAAALMTEDPYEEVYASRNNGDITAPKIHGLSGEYVSGDAENVSTGKAVA